MQAWLITQVLTPRRASQPPAGNTTCTMMMSSQVQLAQNMPPELGGGTGAILTLSQDPCNNPSNPGACCNRKGNCAYWAGAHLVSAGCIQYGVLELEAAFSMPANAGGARACCRLLLMHARR
jgi:hypothetical protein